MRSDFKKPSSWILNEALSFSCICLDEVFWKVNNRIVLTYPIINSSLKFHFISPSVKAVQVLYWGESSSFGSHVSSVTDISSLCLCFVLRVEITIVWYGVKHICRYSFWLLELKIYRTLGNRLEEHFHWFDAVLSRIAICPTDAGKTRRAKERTLKEINRQQIQKGKTPWVFFSIVWNWFMLLWEEPSIWHVLFRQCVTWFKYLYFTIRYCRFPYGLVVRIRRSHRRGPGSIPGVGRWIFFLLVFLFFLFLMYYCILINFNIQPFYFFFTSWQYIFFNKYILFAWDLYRTFDHFSLCIIKVLF